MGAALVLRREALDEVGLFDESFFLYSEEVDLQARLHRAGWEVHYFPDVSVVHHESQFSADIPERRINEMWRSRHRYWQKHHSGAGARVAALATGAQYAARGCVVSDRGTRSGRRSAHAAPRARCLACDGAGSARAGGRMERPCGQYAAALAARRSCSSRCPCWGWRACFPPHGVGLWLRLVAASLVLLLPGALVARALRLRGASATVAWGLGALGPALLLVFVVHGSILLALVVLGVVAVAALPFALRVVSGPPPGDTLVVALLGLAFGLVLWHVAGVVTGDALFHLGRVQKLVRVRRPARPFAWTSSQTAACTRDTPSRSGTRFLRSSRRSAESVRRR